MLSKFVLQSSLEMLLCNLPIKPSFKLLYSANKPEKTPLITPINVIKTQLKTLLKTCSKTAKKLTPKADWNLLFETVFLHELRYFIQPHLAR